MNLRDSVATLPLVGPAYQRKLDKLGIGTIGDLLNHVPHRYLDFSITSPISQAQLGEILTIKGVVTSSKNIYTRYGKQLQIIKVEDETDEISAIWFNQPYLIRTLFEGTRVSLAGKIGEFSHTKALISPEYEISTNGQSVHTGRIVPVYPVTAGISSKWLRSRIDKAYTGVDSNLTDFLPKDLLKEYKFEDLYSAITHVHYPKNLEEIETGKTRLAFNELFFLQLKSTYRKIDWQKTKPAFVLDTHEKEVGKFLNSLAFILTSSQIRSVEEILSDLKKSYPMNRLLEGDVGSGKTVVAATAAFVSFLNGYQSVFMAPTQILAQQHFATLSKLFEPYKIRVSLITSDVKSFDLGRNDIFVGTHALIHNKINFDKVALVVIDEQHRFGVEQREHLMKKTQNRRIAPHTLTMTATPIPRTVALTIYGDLDLSTLDELPIGRQRITTWVIPENKRIAAFDWVEKVIKEEKIQAFIVCPLIEESLNESMKQVAAATKKYEELSGMFKELKIGLLHGKLSSKEKNEVLDKIRSGIFQILVTTPVVEVGIDIPNATIMVIEAADRFGLAQLHQLRGRVGRSEKKSHCLLFSDSSSPLVLDRLRAMTKNLSGFELAEYDLKLRGPGEVFGTRQHGFPELKVAKWTDVDLIKKAKLTAEDVFKNPNRYKELSNFIDLDNLVAN